MAVETRSISLLLPIGVVNRPLIVRSQRICGLRTNIFV